MDRRWRARLVIFAIVAPVTMGAGVFVGMQGVHLSEAQIDSAIETGLQRYEDKIRSSLPQQVDRFTKLVDVHHEKKVVIYTYSVSDINSIFNQSDVSAKLKESMVGLSCKLKEVRYSLENGVTYRYIYEDNNGTEVLHFVIAKLDCIKAQTADTI